MSDIVEFKDFIRSEAVVSRFAEVIGEGRAKAYVNSVALAVASSPVLQKCEPLSIMAAALQAATLRMSCDPQIKQAYLVPYKGRAVLVIGYKGLYDMAIRTGKYRFIQVSEIYEGESIEFDRFTGAARMVGGKKSGTVVGWQGTFVMFDGYGKTIYMSREEIHAHARQYSKGYDRPDGAWKTNEPEMEKKTVLRRLLTKWAYLDPNDAAILQELEERPFQDQEDDEYLNGFVLSETVGEVEAQTEAEIMSDLGYAEPEPAKPAVKAANGKPPAPEHVETPAPRGKSVATSPLQWIVDGGYADNLPNAARIANGLELGKLPRAEQEERVQVYRMWRDHGAEPAVAYEHAKAGNIPGLDVLEPAAN